MFIMIKKGISGIKDKKRTGEKASLNILFGNVHTQAHTSTQKHKNGYTHTLF